ncbi:MAG: DinB family protein [Phycisphaerae bacterium]
MSDDATLRDHVRYVLEGGGAHMGPADVLKDIPPELRGGKPEGLPYTPWRLLEHMRIAQHDILEYTLDPAGWESPDWPDGYWPDTLGPPNEEDWANSIDAFLADNRRMRELVTDPQTSLLEPLPDTPGHTVLRQALLAADHNAYHIGQLLTVRRLLGLEASDGQAPDNL